MKKQLIKFFRRRVFFTTVLLSVLIVWLKLLIPEDYQFIEPISIYGSILAAWIFIYWAILSPTISEYKESEKILLDLQNSLKNVKDDAIYFKGLRDWYDLETYFSVLSKLVSEFFWSIVDNKPETFLSYFDELHQVNLWGEKLWITANHIIRMKSELSTIKKWMLRSLEIKHRDVLPHILHTLKNFITIFVITTLVFMNISKWTDFITQGKESVMLFLVSFLYIYLSFILSSFDNPFDKRTFTGYIDLTYLKEFSEELLQYNISKKWN